MANILAAWQVIRALGAAVAVGAVLLAATPSEAAFPGANGKIVFAAGGDPENVFVMNPDGSDRTQLTHSAGVQMFHPVWRPDGSKILFVHGTTGWVLMDPDGSNPTLLKPRFAAPAWSPDGTKIVYADGSGQVIIEDAFGNGQTYLTGPDARSPVWSPAGDKIAYTAFAAGPYPILTINIDGTARTPLTGDVYPDGFPDWSPDASRIAYNDCSGVFCQIWVMNADGTGKIMLTLGSEPAFSPDGRKIAYTAIDESIHVMNADGSGDTTIAPSGHQVDWQPLPTASYAHPQSAASFQASLVPAFRPCGTGTSPANGQHSPPLGAQSCVPPTPGSNVARVGPSSVGTASFTVVPGDTDPTNGDQADVTLSASVSDVETPGGADYVPNGAGPDLTEITRLRLTDKANNYGGASGTATEYDFRVPIECAATSDPSVGSACFTSTSADSLLPGFIAEQRQTIVQAFRVRVDDAGANGTTGDSDDRIFATQGVYIP